MTSSYRRGHRSPRYYRLWLGWEIVAKMARSMVARRCDHGRKGPSAARDRTAARAASAASGREQGPRWPRGHQGRGRRVPASLGSHIYMGYITVAVLSIGRVSSCFMAPFPGIIGGQSGRHTRLSAMHELVLGRYCVHAPAPLPSRLPPISSFSYAKIMASQSTPLPELRSRQLALCVKCRCRRILAVPA
jgi:hypothetical protein